MGGGEREAEGGKDREIVTKKEYKETREKKNVKQVLSIKGFLSSII